MLFTGSTQASTIIKLSPVPVEYGATLLIVGVARNPIPVDVIVYPESIRISGGKVNFNVHGMTIGKLVIKENIYW